MPNPRNSQSFNRYSYVNNNPIRYNDPSGNRPAGECEDGGGCDETDDNWFVKHNRETGLISVIRLSDKPIGPPEFIIGPADKPLHNPNFSWLYGLSKQNFVYQYINPFLQTIEFVANYGKPAYQRWKGCIPGGPIEGAFGFLTRLAADLNDTSRIRSTGEIIARAFAAGAEDAITEAIATPLGEETGAIGGALTGGSAIGVGFGYVVGAYTTTTVINDQIWWQLNAEHGLFR